jgi:two-component system response regulator TctD
VQKVLLIERDRELALRLGKWLALERYTVDSVTEGSKAVALLGSKKYDFVILDSRIANYSDRKICSYSKASGGETLTLMLIWQLGPTEVNYSGVDDYLAKPFHPRALSAKLRSLGRGGPGGGQDGTDKRPPSGSPVPKRPIVPGGNIETALALDDDENAV